MFLRLAMMSRPMCFERTVLPDTTPKKRLIVRPGMPSVVLMSMGSSAGRTRIGHPESRPYARPARPAPVCHAPIVVRALRQIPLAIALVLAADAPARAVSDGLVIDGIAAQVDGKIVLVSEVLRSVRPQEEAM